MTAEEWAAKGVMFLVGCAFGYWAHNRGRRRGIVEGLKVAKQIANSAAHLAPGPACMGCFHIEHLIGATICKFVETR